MELIELIRKTGQLADMDVATHVGKATLYRGEAHYPVTCFLELNCKDGVYLIFFGLYYDIFRFRFYERKILFKGDHHDTKQYIEEKLVNDLKPLREITPAQFLDRASPMPHGDMGICDNAFVDSIKNYDGGMSISMLVGKIDALGATKRPDAAAVLKPYLHHPKASLRMHAMTAILSLQAPEMENEKLKAILGRIEDPEPVIRDLAHYCSKLLFKEDSDVREEPGGTNPRTVV